MAFDWSPVLVSLRPGEEWTLTDESRLRSLIWISNTPRPTRAELREHVEALITRWRDGLADHMGYPDTSPHFSRRLTLAEFQELRDAYRAARDAEAEEA